MKSKIIFILLIFSTFCNAQIVSIPNANFKAKLLSASPSNTIAKDLNGNFIKIDINNDNEIQNSEAAQISYLNISNSNILASSLIGLETFTNLEEFICSNNSINSLNLTFLSLLKYLNCENPIARIFPRNDSAELHSVPTKNCHNVQKIVLF